MPKIIKGYNAGAELKMPKHGTRPTTQKVKEAIFAIIEHNYFSFEELRVLDIFAGSGNLGLEALSRGASHAFFIDSSSSACSIIRDNIAKMGLKSKAEVICDKAGSWIKKTIIDIENKIDIVFIDPPFKLEEKFVNDILKNLEQNNFLSNGAIVVLERPKRAKELPVFSNSFEQSKPRRYGDSFVWIVQFNSDK